MKQISTKQRKTALFVICVLFAATLGLAGRLVYLMREYENLSCDLSAGSGANALTRDPENAAAFLTEFQDRIYYGCDICASFNTHPFTFREFIDGLCETGAISETVYRKVCRDNAAKLLGL